MIVFDEMSLRYDEGAPPVLRDVDLQIAEGELCLVVGHTGSGKSSLLRTVNGLVPHFSGGILSGRVLVESRDTRTHRPRDLADVVGFVGQDPRAGFVAEVVEDELAFGMEWLGLAPDVMRRRVEETLDLLGLADVRRRALSTLSGGQRQRVAIGAVLAAHPRILVLDEPTSALDPQAAEDVLAALHRLVHDLGTTVLLAEHRLERVVQYADHVLYLPGDGKVIDGAPGEIMRTATVAPPVVELGKLAEWSPLPLSIRDARRAASGLRERLADVDPGVGARAITVIQEHRGSAGSTPGTEATGQRRGPWWRPFSRFRPGHHAQAALPAGTSGDLSVSDGGGAGHASVGRTGAVLAEVSGLAVRYGETVALRGVDVVIHGHEVVAVMGRNGAGKSSLLGAMAGLIEPAAGSVRVGGIDPRSAEPSAAIRTTGMVPQEPTDLLYADSVASECHDADHDTGAAPGSCRSLLSRLAPEIDDRTHPRDLSEGQRLALALAVVLVARPPLVLLDEPTRGLDYPAKRRLAGILRGLAAEGHGVVLATHDVELVADLATRVVVIADGEAVADGETADVVVGSPTFAPQVAKIMAPLPWLTVGQVESALEAVP
ncbi:ATP-binding cassette domain-containing protein [Phytoactinopolyspora alkaliphila]|uniref:ATP-binding cassette domain-containing protein n=1 Tax=Phytoactinopolyspora alkaliphila TaxID=1783498 RepID=A0A6N9YTR3_9ACTN|nr:ATP-binding cassette domain-containing protein [Phytoactinopolyspora alkaliphila]NED98320.1 ATP-binding cassette domain-containing protein [Phytoactinopolyspora alkaliphila]